MALAAHVMVQLAIHGSMLGHKCQRETEREREGEKASSSHTIPHDACRCNYEYCYINYISDMCIYVLGC